MQVVLSRPLVERHLSCSTPAQFSLSSDEPPQQKEDVADDDEDGKDSSDIMSPQSAAHMVQICINCILHIISVTSSPTHICTDSFIQALQLSICLFSFGNAPSAVCTSHLQSVRASVEGVKYT